MDLAKTPIKRQRADLNPSPARKTPLRHMVCMQSPATKALLALPASVSPQTPMTRAKTRALQAGEMFSTYLSPDLDSIALPSCEPSLDFHNDSFRSPSALGSDGLLFRDRLFSPMTRSAARATSTPFGIPQSPLFDVLGSPSMGVLLGASPFGRSPRRDTLARPLLQDSMMACNFASDNLDVFLGDPESKRARKDAGEAKKDLKEKKVPTAAAPKRGEYRCGKCGFFPKKQKHNCAPDKQKKGAAAMAPKHVTAHAFVPGPDATMGGVSGAPTIILTAAPTTHHLSHNPMGFY